MNKQNIIFANIADSCVKETILIKEDPVSRKGIASKTLILLLITFISTLCTFFAFSKEVISQSPEYQLALHAIMILSPMISFILVISSRFLSIKAQKIIAIAYSFVEGIFLGALFSLLNYHFANVLPLVSIAVLSVFCLFLLMGLAFHNGIVKVNQKFISFIITAFILILITDLILFGLGLFGAINENGLIHILVTIFAIVIATLSLAIDFQKAEQIVEQKISKDYEWYVAFGFQITFIYIFIRIIDLMIRLGMFKQRR